MTTEEKIQYWFALSEDHYHTAEDLLKTKHFLPMGFFCHLSVETLFKGYYSKLKPEEIAPPYIHDLPVLAKRAGFYDAFSEEQKNFLNLLTPLNIEARYPSYKRMVASTLNYESCNYVLEETKKLRQWIKEHL